MFNGSYTNDVELAGPLSPYAIGGLIVASGYTGTITLAFPLEVGDFQMAAGIIDQPSSAYGSDLTITGAAVWTGGVLNSTSNATSVIFDGGTVVIDESNDLETRSDLEFVEASRVQQRSRSGNGIRSAALSSLFGDLSPFCRSGS